MKILIAPDSFKDCLSAKEVSDCIKDAVLKVLPGAEVFCVPMADGGEGTVNTITDVLGGKLYKKEVNDPLLRPISAQFGIIDKDKTAIIEMAAASGIELLKGHERNPFITSTYGTGELIIEALNRGCKKIILGIGGSATNDAGVGALMALGVKFYGSEGLISNKIGADLIKIDKIDILEIDKRITSTEILIACDVKNLMTGEKGASYIYAPQKGANEIIVEKLDKNLLHFAMLIKNQFGIDVNQIPGSGAAGGLGGGLASLAGAKLSSGFEIIFEITQLEQHIRWADLIITGEGKIDSMTLYGKTPIGIAHVATGYNKPVIAIAGSLGYGYQELYEHGFSSIHSIIDSPMTLESAIKNAPELIFNTVTSVLRAIITGRNFRTPDLA